jgi:hypothetical protein
LRDGGHIQGVETVAVMTSKEYVPRDVILNKETKRVKFNKHIIVTSKLRDRKQIASD